MTFGSNVSDIYEEYAAFQRDILCIIAGMDEPYGLAIKQELEEYYEEEEVNHGRLYPNLDDFAEQGVVEKGEYDKRTNRYTLTDSGQNVIEARLDWMADQIEDVDRLNV